MSHFQSVQKKKNVDTGNMSTSDQLQFAQRYIRHLLCAHQNEELLTLAFSLTDNRLEFDFSTDMVYRFISNNINGPLR